MPQQVLDLAADLLDVRSEYDVGNWRRLGRRLQRNRKPVLPIFQPDAVAVHPAPPDVLDGVQEHKTVDSVHELEIGEVREEVGLHHRDAHDLLQPFSLVAYSKALGLRHDKKPPVSTDFPDVLRTIGQQPHYPHLRRSSRGLGTGHVTSLSDFLRAGTHLSKRSGRTQARHPGDVLGQGWTVAAR